MIKEEYTSEETDKLTDKELANPQIISAIIKSMAKWDRPNQSRIVGTDLRNENNIKAIKQERIRTITSSISLVISLAALVISMLK